MSLLGPDFVAHAIQLILAPVVMVSACAILLGGMLSRANAINDRLRTLNRERLELLREPTDPTGLIAERISEIDIQTPDLLNRLRLEHRGISALYSAILFFILDMLLIAILALTNQAWAAFLTLLIFLLGLVALCISVMVVAYELQMAMHSITYEVDRVRGIQHPFISADGRAAPRRMPAARPGGGKR